jgi:hypothetical protein
VTKIVFLHIPKTAGQSVHSELVKIYGNSRTSPVRVHHQASPEKQFPDGFDLYSGHLDWHRLRYTQDGAFAFTILRDPFERIASFYFYLRNKASSLSDNTLASPEHTGLHKVKNCSPAAYFFGGEPAWQQFIKDHYDNFYCSYLATGKIRGAAKVSHLPPNTLVEQAINGARQLDGIYRVRSLNFLEKDIYSLTGQYPSLVKTRINAGPKSVQQSRWQDLMSLVDEKWARDKLAEFASSDIVFLDRLNDEGLLI